MPDFAGRIRLGLRFTDYARNFTIENGTAKNSDFVPTAHIMSIGMYPCRKCRCPAKQNNLNGKQPHDSHQTHLLTPSCDTSAPLQIKPDAVCKTRRPLLYS